MRIHTDYLSEIDLVHAADRARVTFARREWRGSRTHQGAWDVILSGSGAYRSQYADRDTPAATWDEWGIFLAYLYRIDPNARCGGAQRPVYANAEHFHWATNGRFLALVWNDQHRLHRWNYGSANITGDYSVSSCRCSAVQRWLINGMSWAEWMYSLDEGPDPAPELTQRQQLERLHAEVTQLRQDIDIDAYDRTVDREAIAQAEDPDNAGRDAMSSPAWMTGTGEMPPAAPLWTPRRGSALVRS